MQVVKHVKAQQSPEFIEYLSVFVANYIYSLDVAPLWNCMNLFVLYQITYNVAQQKILLINKVKVSKKVVINVLNFA